MFCEIINLYKSVNGLPTVSMIVEINYSGWTFFVMFHQYIVGITGKDNLGTEIDINTQTL